MPTPEITLAPADEKDIFLASPDILELVRNQITDTIESLAAAIEVCVTTDGTSLAFLEAIVNYTTQVQAIYEVAELASLVGLPEVCTFINGNLMALDTQEPTAKRVAQPYFEKWPAAVLDYLQTPLTGSQSLVQMMQDRAWPVPLEEEKAHQLLSLLTRSSTTSEPESLASKFEGGVEALAGEKEADEDSTSPADIGLEVTQEISLGNAELLGCLIEELESAKEPLTKELQRFTTLNNQEAAFLEAAENYEDQIQRLHVAAEVFGLPGLQNVCTFLIDNVKLLSKRELAARTKAKKVLEVWPDLVMAYLKSPMDSVIPLLNHLRKSQWAQPLADDQAHELLGLLTQGSTGESTIDEAPAYSRPTQAKLEEVSLKIPSEVNRELLAAYLEAVLPQHASDFSAIIQKMIRSPQTSDIQRAQRIAHTLKGASNILGIKGITNVAHYLEDILEYFAQHHQVAPPKELTNTLVDAADCIELMVGALKEQEEALPAALQVLQSLLDWANQIDKGNLQAPPASSRSSPPASKATPVAVGGVEASAGDATAVTPEQVLKVPIRILDNLIWSVGSNLSRSWRPIQERMKYVLQSNRGLTEPDLILQQQTFALENLVEVHGVTEIMPNRYNPVSPDEESFDALEFKEYQELQSIAHSFMEAIINHRELALSIRNDLAKLKTMFIHQQQLNHECEASVMATRLVPVNTILPRLQHLVRQTCKATNKKAELEVSGTDILIDYGVLNHLMDTLQQVLRDVIEHGIEVPEKRVLLGKPEWGRIHLSFYRKGDNVVVKCQDDGQDLPKILIVDDSLTVRKSLSMLIEKAGFETMLAKDGLEAIEVMNQTRPNVMLVKMEMPRMNGLELTTYMRTNQATQNLPILMITARTTEKHREQAKAAGVDAYWTEPFLGTEVLEWIEKALAGKMKATPVAVAGGLEASANAPTSDLVAGFTGPVLTVSTKTIDNLMRLVGELSISLGQIQERMKHVLQSTRMLTEHGGMLQQQTVALENLVDGRGVTGSSYSRVSHDENSFDTLELKEGHGLRSIAHRFMESMADYRKLARSIRNDLAELETMFIHQQRLNQEFEARVMAIRLVPVNTMLPQLQRLVQQICKATNKKAGLEVSGTDILIDSEVLSDLGYPLQHILRDVIDHGVEAPAERVLLGKPESGRIHLSFYREGNNVVVNCQDDGR